MMRKGAKLFLHFGEEALLLDGFLGDIDSRYHAINPNRLEKLDLHIPSFMVHYGRLDKQTDRQKDNYRGVEPLVHYLY